MYKYFKTVLFFLFFYFFIYLFIYLFFFDTKQSDIRN